MNKIVSIDEALSHVKDGDTIMVGGFMANGSPENLIDYLCSKNIKDLTLICNDTGFIDKGVGKWL
ncbi:CoA-transferase [Clostridioides difficile]|uniref:CoA-transferase n=1 Tax=Clostridioides difficile TaxID=1496 RepID=UPI00038CB1DC|nr:CoA-transferase [Clostridioides difficile]EQH62481.1 coenzyme A transferase family protein [Clostridioides difficile DA00273]